MFAGLKAATAKLHNTHEDIKKQKEEAHRKHLEEVHGEHARHREEMARKHAEAESHKDELKEALKELQLRLCHTVANRVVMRMAKQHLALCFNKWVAVVDQERSEKQLERKVLFSQESQKQLEIKLTAAETEYTFNLKSTKDDHKKEVSNLQNSHKKELEELKAQHRIALQAAQDEVAETRLSYSKQMGQQLSEAERKAKEELERAKGRHLTEAETNRLQYEQEVQAAKDKLTENALAHSKQVQAVRQAVQEQQRMFREAHATRMMANFMKMGKHKCFLMLKEWVKMNQMERNIAEMEKNRIQKEELVRQQQEKITETMLRKTMLAFDSSQKFSVFSALKTNVEDNRIDSQLKNISASAAAERAKIEEQMKSREQKQRETLIQRSMLRMQGNVTKVTMQAWHSFVRENKLVKQMERLNQDQAMVNAMHREQQARAREAVARKAMANLSGKLLHACYQSLKAHVDANKTERQMEEMKMSAIREKEAQEAKDRHKLEEKRNILIRRSMMRMAGEALRTTWLAWNTYVEQMKIERELDAAARANQERTEALMAAEKKALDAESHERYINKQHQESEEAMQRQLAQVKNKFEGLQAIGHRRIEDKYLVTLKWGVFQALLLNTQVQQSWKKLKEEHSRMQKEASSVHEVNAKMAEFCFEQEQERQRAIEQVRSELAEAHDLELEEWKKQYEYGIAMAQHQVEVMVAQVTGEPEPAEPEILHHAAPPPPTDHLHALVRQQTLTLQKHVGSFNTPSNGHAGGGHGFESEAERLQMLEAEVQRKEAERLAALEELEKHKEMGKLQYQKFTKQAYADPKLQKKNFNKQNSGPWTEVMALESLLAEEQQHAQAVNKNLAESERRMDFLKAALEEKGMDPGQMANLPPPAPMPDSDVDGRTAPPPLNLRSSSAEDIEQKKGFMSRLGMSSNKGPAPEESSSGNQVKERKKSFGRSLSFRRKSAKAREARAAAEAAAEYSTLDSVAGSPHLSSPRNHMAEEAAAWL